VLILRRALGAFEQVHELVGERLPYSSRVRFSTRYRLSASGASVIAFSRPLLDAHVEAVAASMRSSDLCAQVTFSFPTAPIETERQLKEWVQMQQQALVEFEASTGRTWHDTIRAATDITARPFATLHACYQSYFYLLRAYQDRAYAVLLELLGDHSGPKASISKVIEKSGAFRRSSRVGDLLAESCGTYGVWFAMFKKMRDDLKFGAPMATCGPCHDIGVIIGTLDEETRGTSTNVSGGYRLGDVAAALDRTRDLVTVLLDNCEADAA